MKSNKYYKLSLLLPALTVLAFSLIVLINKYFVTPPKYDVLLTRDKYTSSPPSVSIQLRDGKLIASIDSKEKDRGIIDELFCFSAKDDKYLDIPYLEQINLEDKTAREQEISIDSVSFNIVSQSETSPDGFNYKRYKTSNALGSISIIINPNASNNKSSINKFFYKKAIDGLPDKFLAWIEVKVHE